jgi:hypothetical protein
MTITFAGGAVRSENHIARFMALIRKNQETGMPLGEAIAAAIRQCIGEGIMADYLKKQGSEVENMLMTEFNIDIAKEVWMEEAREETREVTKLETARAMIKYGDTFEKAALITGIPVGELRRRIKVSDTRPSP